MNTTVDGILNQLLGFSPPAIGFCALIALNLFLRRLPPIPNGLIPVLTVFLGTPMFTWLLTLVAVTKTNPTALNAIYGFVISVGVGCCYGAIVLFAETKWPWLASFINGPDQKSKPPEPPTPS